MRYHHSAERARHRRRNRDGDRTRNMGGYRVTAQWPDGTVTGPESTYDRAKARRWARVLAERGAVATVERHAGHSVWQVWKVYDGPALAARRAAERIAAEREKRFAQQLAAQTERNRRAARLARAMELHEVERLMTRPPVARHVVNGHGTRD
ncbi:hypothetical protein [Streptomyces sp. URMC 129]|uniref:hypothetical protein n=1 Tax=Streptomyces sp. URMC 129 TaxID=3423407 RepID=UPI003F1C49E0